MSITSAIVLYAVTWFMVFFIVLPIRFVSQGDTGAVVLGTPQGGTGDRNGRAEGADDDVDCCAGLAGAGGDHPVGGDLGARSGLARGHDALRGAGLRRRCRRAGKTHCVSPPVFSQAAMRPLVPQNCQRPAPGMGGGEAPALGGTGAGRGLWPPSGLGKVWCVTPAMAGVRVVVGSVLVPLWFERGLGRVQSGGIGNALRFPAGGGEEGPSRQWRGVSPTNGAGRGLWAPVRLRAGVVCGPRRWPGAKGTAQGAVEQTQRRERPHSGGAGNALRFLARGDQGRAGPFHQAQQRPAPGPAGAKRPPWAGRALAGGFGPPVRLRAGVVRDPGDGRGQGGGGECFGAPSG